MQKNVKFLFIITIIYILTLMFLIFNIELRERKLREKDVEIDSLKETIYLLERNGYAE